MNTMLYDLNMQTVSLDVSHLTEQAKQELLDFYRFLLQRPAATSSRLFPPSQLESPNTPSVYAGSPLTLKDMQRAINEEAGKHR